jgi:hypothetical protein
VDSQFSVVFSFDFSDAPVIQYKWSLQPLSILRWFAAMINHVEPQVLQPLLTDIMVPLYRIVEDPHTQDQQMGIFILICLSRSFLLPFLTRMALGS